MVTKVQKWGNSQGLKVTKDLLQAAELSIGDEVEVLVERGRIVVRPVGKPRGRYRLEELLAKMPKNNHAAETAWGPPLGRETW